MDTLLTCLQDNSLPFVNSWMIAAGLAAVVFLLILLFGFWRFVDRHRDWMRDQYLVLDDFLSRHLPRPWQFLKSRFYPNQLVGLELTVGAGLILLLVGLFAEILESWVDEETLFQVDQAAHCAAQDLLAGSSLDVVVMLTHLASGWWLGGLSLILFCALIYRRLRWQALALFLAIGTGQALLWGMKSYFARPRPGQQLLDALGQSFPSGHTFSATVFYSFCIFLVWYFSRCWGAQRQRFARATGTLLGVALILSVATSRILLSVHWVSDILGGLVIGLAWLFISLLLARGWAAYRQWK